MCVCMCVCCVSVCICVVMLYVLRRWRSGLELLLMGLAVLCRVMEKKSSSSSALSPFTFGPFQGLAAWKELSVAGLRRSYPAFEHILQDTDPVLTEELLLRAKAGGMICASFEAYVEKKEEWLRDLNQVLDDLLKCVDFISVACDLDLDFQHGSIEFVDYGYTGRLACAWGPQPQVRRTVGEVVWQAALLRGGSANGDDWKEDEGDGGEGDGGGDDGGGDDGGEGDGGEVLSDVEEVSDAGLNDILLAIGAEDASTSVLKALEE
jgi:hypothetical protein